jgi:exodeoxyribonuclease V
VTWSAQQELALRDVRAWFRQPDGPQVFRLFGYAGTGKTTLSREIEAIAREGGEDKKKAVMFGAFTGKASLVMRQKGCKGASTIHSMIYENESEDGAPPKFTLNPDSDVKNAALVVIDECSMVDEALGTDLLSFGTKVLVLGDPEQLPPVKGAGFFTQAQPDFMLTEVHRQARGNPIIRMSMDLREGKRLQFGDYGAVRVCSKRDLGEIVVMGADQVLCGLNRTRHAYNSFIRLRKGIEEAHPLEGERLVCLKNNRSKGFFNGGIYSVKEVRRVQSERIILHVAPEDSGRSQKEVEIELHPFFLEGREDELPWEVRKTYDEFTFGYVLTVHKSQGSQWDSVVLYDQSGAFREDRSRWLYTGITRAAKYLTVVSRPRRRRHRHRS